MTTQPLIDRSLYSLDLAKELHSHLLTCYGGCDKVHIQLDDSTAFLLQSELDDNTLQAWGELSISVAWAKDKFANSELKNEISTCIYSFLEESGLSSCHEWADTMGEPLADDVLYLQVFQL